MQALGLLVEVEGLGVVRRLPTFLPLLHACLRRCKDGVGVASEEMGERGEEPRGNGGGGEGEGGEEGRVRMMDQLLFTSLSTFSKICQHCDIISSGHAPLPLADMHALWGEWILYCIVD